MEVDTTDQVDQLYALFNQIKENQANGQTIENGPLFDKILSEYAATTAEPHVKRLSAQLICRLMPSLNISDTQQKAAFNALIDLVEDDDSQTRRQVISGLPRLCSTASGQPSSKADQHATKVADVLVQLMETDDEKELSLVQQSLLAVLNLSALAAFDGLFNQLSRVDLPESARRRSIRFLADRILCVDRNQMTPAVEEAIVDRVTVALDDVTETEFSCFVQILASLQCMQTVSGRQRLVDTICAQATDAIDPTDSAEFEPRDAACVARVRGCARQALPFLSKSIKSDKFVLYYLDKVLPQIGRVPELTDGGDRPRLELLQQLAELSCHCSSDFKATDTQLSSLLAVLEAELPHQQDESPSASASVEYNFSNIECLLIALHRLGQARLDYFTNRATEFQRLQSRLKPCLSSSQAYQKSLKPKESSSATVTASNAAAAAVALATTSNVSRLIDGLLRNPVSLLPTEPPLTPSWLIGAQNRRRRQRLAPNRPLGAASAAMPSPTKSSDVGTGAAGGERKRRSADVVDLPTYRPPAGKYSANVGAMPGAGAARGGGRSRYYNVYTGAGAAASADRRGNVGYKR